MHIEAVDFFYLAMPEVTDEADGSQDALLVRVAAGGHVGWGECEAAPLPSIAAFVCPKSHGVCRPVADSVLGKRLDEPADIARLSVEVAYNSMDLLQAPHTFSGIEMALWDVLGKARGEPVWRMLGYSRSHPKTPYASVLFGDTSAGDAGAGRGDAGAQFHRGEIRLGPDRARRYARRCGANRCRPRGAWGRRRAARRHRADLHRRCGARGRAPARARSGARGLVRGAVRGERIGSLRRARAALQHGEARGRRGRAQRAHGEAPDRLRPRRLHPDRLRTHRRHRPVEAGRRLRGRERRHLRQSHLHVPSRAVRLDAALRRASPITASANIPRCPSRSRSK